MGRGIRGCVVAIGQELYCHVVYVGRQARQVDRCQTGGIHRGRIGTAAIRQGELNRPGVGQRASRAVSLRRQLGPQDEGAAVGHQITGVGQGCTLLRYRQVVTAVLRRVGAVAGKLHRNGVGAHRIVDQVRNRRHAAGVSRRRAHRARINLEGQGAAVQGQAFRRQGGTQVH